MLKLPADKEGCISVCKTLISIKNNDANILEWLRIEKQRLHDQNVTEESEIRFRRRQGEIGILNNLLAFFDNAKDKVLKLENQGNYGGDR